MTSIMGYADLNIGDHLCCDCYDQRMQELIDRRSDEISDLRTILDDLELGDGKDEHLLNELRDSVQFLIRTDHQIIALEEQCEPLFSFGEDWFNVDSYRDALDAYEDRKREIADLIRIAESDPELTQEKRDLQIIALEMEEDDMDRPEAESFAYGCGSCHNPLG